ncbi:hypothetical protein Tsubulata_025732 [Turnera subulata]|uniref:Uncharacterized protein n=1 Tax=Turnera subulata TaxID=218843 RepID=A0A9Q0JBF1_9ROSI|nr:hypothetical protein Tsubulata_025732 [Turnera subulata]
MSSPEDPLEGYTGLSLFPRTLRSLPNPPRLNGTDATLPLHDFLKSLPVKNTDRLAMEAKDIFDSTREVSNSEKMAGDRILAAQEEAIPENVAESPRARRPGLGRKRARFSLLPNPNQQSVDLEPTLDIDKLKDPAEFFKAFERQQNAKKEIAKQTGRVSQEQNHFDTSLAPRPRRPGIPGRSRTAKYQHLYPTMSSQETIQEDILSPSNHGSQQETAYVDIASQESESNNVVPSEGEERNLTLEETELAGSVLKAESGVVKLLDELLAEDLDGDGAVNLLQDRLQVKSLNLEKLHFPELPDARRIDLKAAGGILPNHRRALSDIHNLFNLTMSKTPTKNKAADDSVLTLSSPTSPRIPFASLSSLKKRILQSNPQRDPFSDVSTDQSPKGSASFSESRNKSCDHVNVENDSSIACNLTTRLIEEDNPTVGNTSLPEDAVGDDAHRFDKSANDNLGCPGLHGDDVRGDLVLEDSNIDLDSESLHVNLNRHNADVDIRINGPDGAYNMFHEVFEIVQMEEDMQKETVVSAQPEADMVGLSIETSSGIQNQFEQSTDAVIEDHVMDGCCETQDAGLEEIQDVSSEQANDKIKEPSMVSMDKQTKKKPRPPRKRKNEARQSRAEQSSPTIVDDLASNEHSETQATGSEEIQDFASEHPNEKIKESATVTDKQTKKQSRPCKERKRKALSRKQSLAEQPGPAVIEDHAMDGCSETQVPGSEEIEDVPTEKPTEKIKETSVAPINKRTKEQSRPCHERERRALSRMQSLAGLATVIGIKCGSPDANGEPCLKVRSFVSDEYKDLVELAALH